MLRIRLRRTGAKKQPRYRVVAFDSGIKFNILRRLSEAGCSVRVVPPTTSAADVLELDPAGVFLANGPGDPPALGYLSGTLPDVRALNPGFHP